MGEPYNAKVAQLLFIADIAMQQGKELGQRYFNKDNKVCIVGAMNLQGQTKTSVAERIGLMSGWDGVKLDNPALSFLVNREDFQENYKASRIAREILTDEGKIS